MWTLSNSHANWRCGKLLDQPQPMSHLHFYFAATTAINPVIVFGVEANNLWIKWFGVFYVFNLTIAMSLNWAIFAMFHPSIFELEQLLHQTSNELRIAMEITATKTISFSDWNLKLCGEIKVHTANTWIYRWFWLRWTLNTNLSMPTHWIEMRVLLACSHAPCISELKQWGTFTLNDFKSHDASGMNQR